MGKQVAKKVTWVIKNFSSLPPAKIYSDQFELGGCKWHLLAYPKGNLVANYLSLFLEVVDFKSLPTGWKRYVKVGLTIARQVSVEPSVRKETHRWFDKHQFIWGFPSMIPLTTLHDTNGGFLVNGELMIAAEVDILQVIGSSMESEETNPSKKLKVEPISSTQDNAVDFREKIQHLKTGCMNVLLSLTQTLCQTPQELSIDDLSEAEKALVYMKYSGLEVDWLEKKLEEVKENKKEQSG